MIERIIPTPKRIQRSEGTLSLAFSVSCCYAPWKKHCETVKEMFQKCFRLSLSDGEDGIVLAKDETLPKGHYRIDTTNKAILSASDEEGLLYAIASFLQWVSAESGEGVMQKNGRLLVEKAVAEDFPEKDYRGVMVDLARQWHPARTVHCYIDICFMLKLNYLHLHLIDDQRYTLPSKAFPKLNEDGEHYSFEEVASFCEHAKKLGVTLIPEFETPGHAKKLNEAYPEIFANEMENDGGEMISEAGAVITAENVICAGSEKTMGGIRTILEEICEMFPDSPYLHIGGDEANSSAWDSCAHCKKYMKENGIGGVGELYSDFVGRVARLVLDMGRTPIVWEGFPKEGAQRIPKETIVIAWESYYHLAPDLIRAGFKIINCSWSPMYIVPSLLRRWNFADILRWNVYHWQHFWVKSAATLNPIDIPPTEQVWGGQFAIWECTYEQEISRAMENLPALAERTWTVERLLDDDTFRRRMAQIVRILSHVIQER